MTKILLVRDNEKLNDENRRALEGEGHTVFCALTLEAAKTILKQNEPDIILLDADVPDGDGLSSCKEVREQTKARIIFLAESKEHSELAQGLGLGSDDYIKKPYTSDELISHVAAAAKHKEAQSNTPESLERGNLKIDLINNQAYVNDFSLDLKPKEFQLLHYFALNENKLLSAEDLYNKVWTQQKGTDKRVVQRRVSELRTSLADCGCTHTVNSIYGKGYCFESM